MEITISTVMEKQAQAEVPQGTMSSATGIKKRNRFTLLELVCVIAISALLIGFVVGRIGKLPALLTFKNALYQITELMDQAANRSEFTGEKVVILYENGDFSPEDKKLNRTGSRLSYSIPSFIRVYFKDNNFPKKQFIFFPDGTAVGPDMFFSYKGHEAKIIVSRLTGVPILKFNEN